MTIRVAVDLDKGFLNLLVQDDPARLSELKTALSGYLNTRPEAPNWIWRLCDSLEATPMPVRIES